MNEYSDNESVHESDTEIDHTDEQLDNLCVMISELENTIREYTEDVRTIWDNVVVPFLSSGDCMTLGNLTTSDYHKFLAFMLSQKTNRIMVSSHARLLEQKTRLDCQSIV
jgi:hypothetical protein